MSSIKTIDILRVGQSPFGTFGVMREGQTPFALTLERPWEDNAPNRSCVPAGVYLCEAYDSPKFGPTYRVLDVPGREGILFHTGNRLRDTLGCILVGEEFALDGERPFLARSRDGFHEFLQRVKGNQRFSLRILECVV